MKVVVVGASRGSGAAAVRELAARGHDVTAFSRTAGSGLPDGVRVVRGDVGDAEALAKAVAGQDAVLVTLGISDNPLGVRLRRRASTPLDVRSAGTAAVVAAMREVGVRRLVVQTTYGLGAGRAHLSTAYRLIFRLVLAPQLADTERQEEVVRASGLDWTLVRPVGLHDGDAAGPAEVGLADEVVGMKVSRGQVAAVHADTLERADRVGRVLSVSAA